MAVTMQYAAIPTKYNGVQFRSRLEARWAAMFDLLSWEWEYEPFDAFGYIPDFRIRFKTTLIVEVKPYEPLTEEWLDYGCWLRTAQKIRTSGIDQRFMIVGNGITKTNNRFCSLGPICFEGSSELDALSVVGSCVKHGGYSPILVCDKCSGDDDVTWANFDSLHLFWKEAGNHVQYKGAR